MSVTDVSGRQFQKNFRDMLLLALVACLAPLSHAWAHQRVDKSWKLHYKEWRHRETVPMAQWLDGIPPAKHATPFREWNEMPIDEKRDLFESCITSAAVSLSRRVQGYRSPDLLEVQQVSTCFAVLQCAFL